METTVFSVILSGGRSLREGFHWANLTLNIVLLIIKAKSQALQISLVQVSYRRLVSAGLKSFSTDFGDTTNQLKKETRMMWLSVFLVVHLEVHSLHDATCTGMLSTHQTLWFVVSVT